jgi:hypothetical protein
MKFVANRAFADPEAAARKLLEIANTVEPVQDGRIHIEKINWPMLMFGLLIVILLIVGSLRIMTHLNHNMMPMERIIQQH